MKKFGRGLYVAIIYIVGAPIAAIYLTIMFLVCLITTKKYTGAFGVGETIKGMWSGLREGHDLLMFWVRHGEYDHYGYITMKAKDSN
jgi:hypothetical protein